MKVEVARTGGIVGIPFRATLDTAHLLPAKARLIENAVQSLPFDQPPSNPRHPDAFQYEIVVDPDGGRQTATLDEADVPEALRLLINEAVTSGLSGE